MPACALVAGLALAGGAASAPGALLVSGVLALLWRDPGSWGSSEILQAWLVAFGTLIVIAAAAAERERAARVTSTSVAAAWMVLVLGAVAIWTGALLLLRDLLRGTDLLPFIPSGSTMGKVALVGLLLLCVTGAGLLLRSRKAAI